LNLEPLVEKWRKFGWQVYEVNGHNLKGLLKILKKIPVAKNKPHMIICHTIKGKGVSFAENKMEWHYFNLSKSQYKQALRELE